MPSYEKGAYEPSDEVRVFDAAEDEDEDEEGSRLPLLIVMALLVLAAFGGVVWLAYEHGVASGRTEPRVLTAEEGPAKVAPSNAGGTETPYKGLKIYEQPAPNDEETDTTNVAPVKPQSPSMAATAPTPTVVATVTAAAQMQPAAPIAKPSAKPAPVAKAAAATPKPAPATAVAALAPAEKPKAPAVAANDSTPFATTTTKAAPAPAAPAPTEQAAVQPPAQTTAPAGSYVLQIGAYKSEDEARSSWKAFAAKHSALMSGFDPDIKKVDLGDKGVWYRLRIGAFDSKDAATAECEKLKADGGTCFLAK